MRTVAIVQARMGSTRLPGKVLMPLAGRPMLERVLDRIREARRIDDIVVATSTNDADDAVQDLVDQLDGIFLFRGDEEDVLSRYVGAADAHAAEYVLRATSDNPFFDPPTADRLIEMMDEGYDYVANNLKRTYPYGIDLEVFRVEALRRAHREATEPREREHVTPYIREHPELFSLGNLQLDIDLSHVRLTVDTEEDYEKARSIFEQYGKRIDFRTLENVDAG